MPRVNNVGNLSNNGFVITDPDAYQMYSSDQVYSYTMEEDTEDEGLKYPFIKSGISEVPLTHQEEVEETPHYTVLDHIKPGPNGYSEIPFEVAQNFFDITELEDQACPTTGRTKFRMMIDGQEVIIDGTVTPVSEYVAQMQQQQQQPVGMELEGIPEAPISYSVMHLPESMLNNAQSMQVITLPDGQLALQVTQAEQKQMAQMVTVDEEGNIIASEAPFAIGMDDVAQQQMVSGQTMMTMQQDEFGNMYLQEEQAPSTSMAPFGMMEVTGDPAEIAAMYPGMQMIAMNPDGTIESVTNTSDCIAGVSETTYVNARQYHRIMKRREARAKLEASGRVPKCRSKYLHESRHRHALNRVRGEGGKFNSKKEKEPFNITDDIDSDHSSAKILKPEIESPEKKANESIEEKKDDVPVEFRKRFKQSAPALKARNPTPLTNRAAATSSTSQQRPTAVITHMPLPPQGKARPPGFRVARPSEIKKLLPTTYSIPGSTAQKVDTLPEKILEESPSNSNSPLHSTDFDENPAEDSDFS